MSQATLFDHARHDDPQTSHDAAAAVDLPARCAQVLGALRYVYPAYRGATCSELQHRLAVTGTHMDNGWIARRLCDLEKSGHVVRTEATRPGSTGRKQTVWILR